MTTKPQHTPGPWKDDGYDNATDAVIVHSQWGEVCRVNHGGDSEYQDANARLIAAAPEMLQSLQSLFEHCAMIHNRGGEWCNQREADAAVKAARAAIKKATGEP